MSDYLITWGIMIVLLGRGLATYSDSGVIKGKTQRDK
jgi:hypothetical protein